MGGMISYCLVQQVTTVRVMRFDGEVLEFDQPIIAKQLMKMFPGHLVVHCAQVSQNSGIENRSKVSILRAEDTLQLGQTYCLLRVPAHQGKDQPGAKASNGDGSAAKQLDLNILNAWLPNPPLAALKQHHLGGPWRPHLDAIIESPLNAYTPSRAHSLTMSPLARQAGYVPMNPAQVTPITSPTSSRNY